MDTVKKSLNKSIYNTTIMPLIRHRADLIKSGYDQIISKEFKVQWVEVFDVKYLYMLMHEWFCENGYASRSDADFPEIAFEQRETVRGKEIWFRWRFTKKLPDKYWEIWVEVDVHILGLNDVEVVVNNEKVKANKGDCEIVTAFILLFDKKSWDESPIKSQFKWLYKTFLKKKNEAMKTDLTYEAGRYQDALKEYFKIPGYGQEKAFGGTYAERP